MKRSSLATRLLRARNKSERRKLLAANRKLADVGLARELKDHCYRVWTSEPSGARAAAAALDSLAEISSDREIDALHRWVEGIADITNGKLESAIVNLDSASRLLLRLGREHESAQPQVAKLIALAMLGEYDKAQRAGERALIIFRKYRDQLAAGKIEMNLSNIVSRLDQYKLAETYCLSAYRRFKKLGEKSWQTMAENGLANTYTELNDFKRAEEFYGRALSTARTAGMHVTVAEIEASIGNLELFRGRFADALRLLELSRQKYEKLKMPHQTAVAELEIADIYTELNLSLEAIEMYRRLIPTLRRLRMRAEEARAHSNLGRALISNGNTRDARTESKRAAQLFEIEKNFIASAAVGIRLASLELSQDQYESALALVERSAATLDESGNIRLRLSAAWLRGETLHKLGRVEEAQQLLAAVLKESKRSEQPAIAQTAMNSLGMMAFQTGRPRDAEALFEASIATAESARAPLPGEEFRMAFLAKSLEPFDNLSRLYLAEGDVERAFITVERSRARSLFESVTSSGGNRENSSSAKLREELNWFYSRLSRAEAAEVPKLQKEVQAREKKLAALALRGQSASGSRVGGTSRELSVAALQKHLGPSTALIEFVEKAGVYSAFIITNDRLEFVEDIATEQDVLSLLEGLHFQFGALRFGMDAVRDFVPQLKARADVYLRQLHSKLLQPVVRFVGERDLVIVPAKALNYVPFAALLDEERYAIESRDIRFAPSAHVWMELAKRRVKPLRSSLLMSYADTRIPLADREVNELAMTLPNPVKFNGKRATFSAFQTHAPKFDLIHLACHGQFRPDNPMFSSLHLADGWVTVRDVCSRKIGAGLVTLSACETGLSRVFAGEEILGLARGFLSAGARSLLLSLWTVNDEATSRLMTGFYANLQRGLSVSASLRVAQKDFIDRGEHPYLWSPFFVIG